MKNGMKPNQVMHNLYGIIHGEFCIDCPHMVSNGVADKCRIYGVSASEATDMPKYATACGMINKERNNQLRPVYQWYKGSSVEMPLEGQIGMDL